MSDQFVAEIRIVASNFAPTGWAQCNGQILPISKNTALFSLLGTYYGGDGKWTFALPDLQGRAPMMQGQGQGLSEYWLGQSAGSETITLLQSEIPLHNHFAQIMEGNPTTDPAQAGWGSSITDRYHAVDNTANMNAQALSIAGSSLPHNNMQPYLTLNFIIALQGIFPARH